MQSTEDIKNNLEECGTGKKLCSSDVRSLTQINQISHKGKQTVHDVEVFIDMIKGMRLLHMQQACIWILRRWVARTGGIWNSNKITSNDIDGGGELLGSPARTCQYLQKFCYKTCLRQYKHPTNKV